MLLCIRFIVPNGEELNVWNYNNQMWQHSNYYDILKNFIKVIEVCSNKIKTKMASKLAR